MCIKTTINARLKKFIAQLTWYPTYLGVTPDHTLSYREHLTKTAGKLKNQNNLLMKLAGSTWGTSANTLRSSALVLCYSAAEYCTPVRSRSAHTSQVDVQLNSTMHVISGTLHSSLSNIEPLALRKKAGTDKLVEKIVKHGQSSLISSTHQTLICVFAVRPRWCPTLSIPVFWQSWMVARPGYTPWMKTLFRGWPIMVHDMHTRRRKINTSSEYLTNWWLCDLV